MITTPRILVFAGSLRQESFNKRLARIGAGAAREAGADVTLVDLLDYPMPIFNQDDEEAHGMPEHARRFKQLLREHHGFFIASPEYNSGISGVLKNAIDWASRAESPEEPPVVAFRGKTGALVSASIGALGGLRGLVNVRTILGNIGMILLPDQVCIPNAEEAFLGPDSLKDRRKQEQVEALAHQLVEFTRKVA